MVDYAVENPSAAVAVLHEGPQAGGQQSVRWDGTLRGEQPAGAGLYLPDLPAGC